MNIFMFLYIHSFIHSFIHSEDALPRRRESCDSSRVTRLRIVAMAADEDIDKYMCIHGMQWYKNVQTYI